MALKPSGASIRQGAQMSGQHSALLGNSRPRAPISPGRVPLARTPDLTMTGHYEDTPLVSRGLAGLPHSVEASATIHLPPESFTAKKSAGCQRRAYIKGCPCGIRDGLRP